MFLRFCSSLLFDLLLMWIGSEGQKGGAEGQVFFFFLKNKVFVFFIRGYEEENRE